jgi:phage terminase large subunit-like protein
MTAAADTIPRKTRSARRRVKRPPVLSPIAQTVQRYMDGVLDGTIPAGELIRLAVQRQIDDLRDGPSRGLRFDQQKAEQAVEFFSYLKHSKGEWAGREFVLEPWQMFTVWVLFGWLNADGYRRFRTAYEEVPRKNGKSTKAAGVGLKLAFADGEPGAEVYSAATKKDQAIIVHSEATRMVQATPALRAKIQVFKNNLCRPDTYQKYEPLGADEDTQDGLNVHAAIVDELHAHKTRGVFDLMETGTSARRQPLLFAITTAGTDQSAASVCWEQHVYAEQILRKIIADDSYFAFIAAMDEGDDWRDERSWFKANPNLGVSKKLDYMRDQARKCENMPAKLNSFLRLDLNKWTQQVNRWIDMTLWDANAGPPVDEETLRGRACFGGLDLSSVSDLTAWVLLFPDPVVPDRVTIVPRVWCPESRLLDDQRNQYRDQYQAWARNGWLRTTPGNAIDYDTIKAQILQDAQDFQIQEVAVDRLFQGYQLSMQLADEGLTVAACGMGFMGMAGPCKEFERRLLGHHLQHGGHPVLKWMANNVAVREDPAGNLKPDKASSQGKIDGIIGILLALDRIMRHTASPSVYESRGLLLLGGATDGQTSEEDARGDVRSEPVAAENETAD